jgi:hypothetical protein
MPLLNASMKPARRPGSAPPDGTTRGLDMRAAGAPVPAVGGIGLTGALG